MSNCDARSVFVDLAEMRRDSSDQNRMASRKAETLLGRSTIDPWTPFSMISLKPLSRVVMTGSPDASASRHAFENGS